MLTKNVSFGNTVIIPCKTLERANELTDDVRQISNQNNMTSLTMPSKLDSKNCALIVTANDIDESYMLQELAQKYPELNPIKNFSKLYGNTTRSLDITI
ncbi:MAG: hypothetical protein A2104_04590 [Candidatus Melainabacteria bacterium GWF2_32_7]|nr:MAG: hypothetical protein A2104_04590 [Candidatus Melainabacteria bacterium GWF2_32_7]